MKMVFARCLPVVALALLTACGASNTRPLLPDHISVTPSTTSIVVGDSVTLQGQVLALGDRPLGGFTIIWSSKNQTIASVDSSTGAVKGNQPGTVEIDATTAGVSGSAQITVTPRPTLAITKTGNGSVTSTPAGIDCGATCTTTFYPGTTVSLAAVADPGNTFTGWTGACTGLGACQLTMNADTQVSATFVQGERLTVSVSGPGSVTSTPSGIDCTGGECSAIFDTGTAVSLSATPGTSAAFTAWGGACSGTGACAVNMSAAQSLSATFESVHSLNVTVVGQGEVTGAGGFDCTSSTCNKVYPAGTTLDLQATPTEGWRFAGYSGACVGATCNLALTDDLNVTATFVRVHQLTVSINGNGTGSVSSIPAGLVCTTAQGICTAQFDEGTPIALSASPGAGGALSTWGGACTGSDTCGFTLEADTTVSATFIAVQTLSVAVSGSGTVTSAPAGISCSAGSCSAKFPKGATVTLSATPGSHALFNGFAGDCAGNNCSLSMNADHVVSASFIAAFNLTVAVSGNGGGAVTSAPAGINCGTACSMLYPVGTSVTLTATADGTSTFTGWSGFCSGTSPTCTVPVNADTNVGAVFVAGEQLSVSVQGPGTVTSTPSGLFCASGTCTAIFPVGTPVSLTATPSNSAQFNGWTGDCSGSTCAVTMNAGHSVSASFGTVHSLTVHIAGSGSVSSTGFQCTQSTCTQAFADQTALTMSAAPSNGWQFQGWTGDCTGASCNLTMSQDRTITATFVLVHTLTVNISGDGLGSISSSPAGINCVAGSAQNCSAQFTDGAQITLTAIASGNSLFQGWSGAGCSGTGSCSLTLTADATVSGTLVAAQNLTINFSGSGPGGSVTSGSPPLNCSSSGVSCTYLLPKNTLISLSASPATHSMFTGWTGGGCSGTGGCAVTLSADTTVTAGFAAAFGITVNVTGSGAGTVSSSPGGFSCTTDTCTFLFAPNTPVTLTAAANTAGGSQFTGWSGACAGSSTCALTMSQDYSATATFTHFNTLTVTGVTGSGTVTPSDASWSCTAGNGSCSHSYPTGTSVTLHGAGNTGWAFDPGFSGDCSGSADCALTMNGDHNVAAAFQPQLSITIAGSGSVSGTASCGAGTCTPDFAVGTAVSLTATASNGYQFTGWTGACTGTGACSTTLNAPISVTATFTKLFTLAVATQGQGTGSVAFSPTGSNCTTVGSTTTCTYLQGVSVTLSETPGGNSAWAGWGGDCSGLATTCTLSNIAANHVVSANFGQVVTLTIAIPAGGAGYVQSDDQTTIDCHSDGTTVTGTCTAGFSAGQKVNLTATAGTDIDPLHSIFKSFKLSTTSAECPGDSVSASGGTCTTPALNTAQTVTAAFNKAFDVQVHLNDVANPSNCGAGSVTFNPQPAEPVTATKDGSCSTQGFFAIFETGTAVTMTATAGTNSYFGGWQGACTATPCTLTVAQDYTGANQVIALFGKGSGPQSGGAPVPPAVAAGNGSATLWWPASADSSYNLYFAREPDVSRGNYALLAGGGALSGLTNGARIDGLQAGATYFFVLTRVDAFGESSESAAVARRIEGSETAATSSGARHGLGCASLAGGALRCWGGLASGELAIADAAQVVVGGATDATAFACALHVGGAVSCWGDNSRGQLGSASAAYSAAPLVVPGVAGASGVVARGDGACARFADGSSRCWGESR